MSVETQTESVSVPAAPEAKAELIAATKSGKARSRFKSVEDVVAEGVKAGEKEIAEGAKQADPEPDQLENELAFEAQIEDGARAYEGTEAHQQEAGAADAAKEAAENIRIGERTFTSTAEAMAYAQELEQRRIADDAFRQGIEAAQNLAPGNSLPATPAEPTEPEKIPDLYYTDPAAYFKQRESELITKASQTVLGQVEQQKRYEITMNKFWEDHPDLARNGATKDLTTAILNYSFESLKNVTTEKALQIIAEKARAKLKELGVTTLPQKVLPSNAKPAVSSGSGTVLTRPKQEEKPLNWTAQMRNMKAKKAEARRVR